MNYFIAIILLVLTTFQAKAQLRAPIDVSISQEQSTSFIVTFANISEASRYRILVISQHDPADNITLEVEQNIAVINNRRSNVIYNVEVRGVDSNGTLGMATISTARTAPDGCRILQAITTPSSITVFLEEVSGATGWEIEYGNTDTGEIRILRVPDETPSNTFYVAILHSLNPNTDYLLRVRVSQLNFRKNFTAEQSPYGEVTTISTDQLSAFGRIVMLQRTFVVANENEMSNLRREIEEELQSEFRLAARDSTLNVSVIDLERSSNNFLVHLEILLPDQTTPPNISAFVPNRTLYESDVRFNVAGTPGYFFTERYILGYNGFLCASSRNQMTNWTSYSNSDATKPVDVEKLGADINNRQTFAFSNTEIALVSNVANSSVFNLTQNTIYGIRQNYLLRTCPENDTSISFFDRIYGAFSLSTTLESSRYTIFYTSDLLSISTDPVTSTPQPDGRAVTLSIPSGLVSRIISYEFVFNGSVIATLTEKDLDGSSSFAIRLDNLSKGTENNISIVARVRKHDNTTSTAITTLTVITDVDECINAASNNCHENATCQNEIGNFSCFCNNGFTGNGFNCSDVDECLMSNPCSSASCRNTLGSFVCVCMNGFSWNGTACLDDNECLIPRVCHSLATCSNSNGSFACTCQTGFSENGITTCNDINECNITNSLQNCDPNANCINNIGSFQCICQNGYSGNGRICVDINECEDRNLHNCYTNADCINTNGTFDCRCRDGFSGNGTYCIDVNECNITEHNCSVNSDCINQNGIISFQHCDPNANCINNIGSFQCICQNGYSGSGRICVDINECEDRNLHNCYTNADCINTNGTFGCRCRDGFSGNGTYCIDVNECNITEHNCSTNADCASGFQHCDPNAKCLNAIGSFQCICQNGYSGNGRICVDINECEDSKLHNCSTDADCINSNGTFGCRCRDGFSGNGTYCVDVNECNITEHNCSANADCINLNDTIICKCQNGFAGDGKACVDVNECIKLDLHNCTDGQTCKNLIGSFTCEENVPPFQEQNLSWIVAIVVVLILILLITTYTIWHIRNKNRKKGHYDLEETRARFDKASQDIINIGFDENLESSFHYNFVVNPKSKGKRKTRNKPLNEPDVVDTLPMNDITSASDEALSNANGLPETATSPSLNRKLKSNSDANQAGLSKPPSDASHALENEAFDGDSDSAESTLSYTLVINPDPSQDERAANDELNKTELVDPLPVPSETSHDLAVTETDLESFSYTYVVNPESGEKTNCNHDKIDTSKYIEPLPQNI